MSKKLVTQVNQVSANITRKHDCRDNRPWGPGAQGYQRNCPDAISNKVTVIQKPSGLHGGICHIGCPGLSRGRPTKGTPRLGRAVGLSRRWGASRGPGPRPHLGCPRVTRAPSIASPSSGILAPACRAPCRGARACVTPNRARNAVSFHQSPRIASTAPGVVAIAFLAAFTRLAGGGRARDDAASRGPSRSREGGEEGDRDHPGGGGRDARRLVEGDGVPGAVRGDAGAVPGRGRRQAGARSRTRGTRLRGPGRPWDSRDEVAARALATLPNADSGPLARSGGPLSGTTAGKTRGIRCDECLVPDSRARASRSQ